MSKLPSTTIQIKISGYIIIGSNDYFSFADEGLIQKYQDVYLNLWIKSVTGIS